MSVKKYLFWFCDEGIKSYKVKASGAFEILRPSGREVYQSKDWNEFYTWFQSCARIVEEDYIDYCFLSQNGEDFPEIEGLTDVKSSWDKPEIHRFCKEFLGFESYEIHYGDDLKFVCQEGNIFVGDDLKKLHLKCVPEFSMETKAVAEDGSEGTSILNQYFIERLNSTR